MLCMLPPSSLSASGSQRRVGVPASRVTPGWGLESPRRAWWRGLFSWGAGPEEGDAGSEGEDSQAAGSANGWDEEPAARPEIPLSCPSSAASRKRLHTASTTLPPTASSSTVSQPSDHLKWARQVSKLQGEWHRQQRWLNHGSPVRRGRKREGWMPPNTKAVRRASEHVPGSVNKLVPPDRAWVQALRGDVGLEPPPSDWQEKKHVRLRRERALQRLHLSQMIWRQDQERKGSQSTKYESILDAQEIAEKASGEEWDWPAGDAIALVPVCESTELGETEVGAGRNAVPRRVTSAGGNSEDGMDHESLRSKRSASSLSSGSDGESARSAPRRFAASRKEAPGKPSLSRSTSGLSDVGSIAENRAAQADNQASSGIFDDYLQLTDMAEESISRPTGAPKATSGASSAGSAAETPDFMEEASEPSARPIQEEPVSLGASSYDDVRRVSNQPGSMVRSRGDGRGALKRELSLDVLEEWRTEFPLEVLDAITDYYESVSLEDDGTKIILVPQLQEVSASVLGFPPQVVLNELTHCSLPRAHRHRPSLMVPSVASPADSRGVIFSSLMQFLDFFRAAVDGMEKEQTELVWSQGDLRHVANIFSRHANSLNCIPMAILFQVIQELGFEDLRVEDLEQQRWLKDITRSTLEGRRASSNTGGVGTLSLQDFTRIVTFALREKEKAKRLEDFARERQVRKLAGFSPLEMEDLRELHRTYANLEVPVWRIEAGSKDPLVRMTLLLHNCGLGNLSERDAGALQRIVRKLTPPADMERLVGDTAPFDVFMLWMREVFAQSIGNLEWTGTVSTMSSKKSQGAKFLPSELELEGRKGFTIGMLREALRCNVLNSSGERWEFGDVDMGSPVSRCESDDGKRGSAESLTGRSRLRSTLMESQTHRSTITESQKYRNSTITESQNPRRSSGDVSTPRARRRSGEQQTFGSPGRGSRSSRIESRTSSQTNSRRGSGQFSDGACSSLGQQPGAGSGPPGSKGSLPSVPGGGAVQDDAFRIQPRAKGASGTSVMIMKGLPPSEAMLGRKDFRACSVDLTNVTGLPSQVDGSDIAAKVEAMARRSQLTSLPQLPAEAVGKGVGQAKRKMKPVQDSLDVVNSAIAKLSMEQDPPSPSGNTPKSPSMQQVLEEIPLGSPEPSA